MKSKKRTNSKLSTSLTTLLKCRSKPSEKLVWKKPKRIEEKKDDSLYHNGDLSGHLGRRSYDDVLHITSEDIKEYPSLMVPKF